jgi:Na+/melibiose symporter-like transporter
VNKAFIVIGILANVAAMVALCASGPNLGSSAISAAIASFAGFSYLIVWVMYAELVNTDRNECGVKDSNAKLGAAFNCTVIAWLLCWVAAAASRQASKQ